MTRKEAINRLTNTLQEMRAFFFDSKHISEDDEKDLASMEMAIEALEQEQDILFKIFCIVHPLSIMSTQELEHKAIMQIAEMLEPLCLPESEDQ